MQALYTNVFSTGPILLVPDPYSGQYKTNDAAESLIDWFIDTDYKIYSTQHFRIDHSSSKSSTYYEVKNNFDYYAIITQAEAATMAEDLVQRSVMNPRDLVLPKAEEETPGEAPAPSPAPSPAPAPSPPAGGEPEDP